MVSGSYTIETRDGTSSSQMDVGDGTFDDTLARLSCTVTAVSDSPYSWTDSVVSSCW